MLGLIRKDHTVYYVAGIFSLFLSAWIGARETVINPDAICYLQSAASLSHGLFYAMHVCAQATWPFYAILIAGVVKIFHFSFQTAAFVLDGLFSLISVLTFLSIVRFIKNDSRLLWFAAAVVLLSHEFNSVRQYIVRDHGFWAFYLLSIYYLLNFFRTAQWRDALLWSASLMIATLFRVEGAIFIVLLPWLVWFDRQAMLCTRFISFLKLNILLMVGGVLAIGMILHFHLDISRLHEIGFQVREGAHLILVHFSEMKAALVKNILTVDSARDVSIVLSLMLLSWYVVNAVLNVSLIYFVLILYAFTRRLLTDNRACLVLLGYIVVNVLVTSIFFVEYLFLSKRYLIALSLVLMIWVPFALNALAEQKVTHHLAYSAAIFFVIVSSLGGIFDFGYSKQYIRDAGNFLADNVPAQSTLYANDYQLLYYSHHFGDDFFKTAEQFLNTNITKNNQWQQYEFVAIRTDQKSLASLNTISYPLWKTFQNKRGDQIRIYRRANA